MNEGVCELKGREFVDDRGRVRVFEGEEDVPFPIRRCFVISDVPAGKTRARHVVTSEQYLVALTGSCMALTRTGETEKRFPLRNGGHGLHVSRGTWLLLEHFSSDAVILVLSSEKYVSPPRPPAQP